MALLPIVAAAISLLVGATALAPAGVAFTLLHPNAAGTLHTIVWQLRLPRVCIAAAVGASLALCGALLQGMLRNPLVDPYLTGVSAGAAAAIAIAIVAGVSAAATPGIGFAAGLGSALLVAALARRGSGIDSNRLILAGVSLSTLFAAIVTLALVRARIQPVCQRGRRVAGGLDGRTWLARSGDGSALHARSVRRSPSSLRHRSMPCGSASFARAPSGSTSKTRSG